MQRRYFFNITDGSRIVDISGTTLDSLEAAKAEAVRRAGKHLSTTTETGFWTGEPWAMDCRDDTGLVLFVLNFYGLESAATAPLSNAL
jgi:hypothetical protein